MESASVEELCIRARRAGQVMQTASGKMKDAALKGVRDALERQRSVIEEANRRDKEYANSKDLSMTLVKRLDLEGPKFDQMLENVESVMRLPDPVGTVMMARKLLDGLDLYRVTCPIGVINVIFEARPEAAVQIASLCIKSGNALLLKGGKEASNSNAALVECIRDGIESAGLPRDTVSLISSRDQIAEVLKMDRYVDLVIPRGSNELVRYITDNTRIPVLGHADGICAVYVDKDADVDKAAKIVVDSKSQYVSVCNAAETLLVNRSVMEKQLPVIGKALAEAGVTMRADAETLPFLPADKTKSANDEDYDSEFLDYIIAVKAVDSVDEAIAHINAHGSHHTDCIVTENKQTAEKFLAGVDSANVYHNASTRFADGFRYGFGAEVGVSTCRTHSRGPVGVEGLLIYKYRLYGNGHTVGAMVKDGIPFLHKDIDPALPQP